jgi:hypothetical protein
VPPAGGLHQTQRHLSVAILRRIWIRFQGASMGAYALYVLIDATPKTDSKTGKMVDFISSSALNDLQSR